jgi:hypothetical protein
MLPFVKNETFVLTEYAGEYQLGLGPLTNNGADFLGWEKIPQSLRGQFSSQTLKDLAQFPSDWPEIEVRMFLSVTHNSASLPCILTWYGFLVFCLSCVYRQLFRS